MITPVLEKMILCGEAEYKTWSFGGGAVGTIPVSPGTYIVITDFIWHPFFDDDLTSSSNQPRILTFRNTKQLQLRSGGRNNVYLFRDELQLTNLGDGTATPLWMYNVGARQIIDCFFKCQEPVFIDIVVVPDNTSWFPVDFNPLEPVSAEPSEPHGYGTTATGAPLFTLRRFRMEVAQNSIIDVPGFKRNPIVDSPDNSEQFVSEYTPFTQLLNPASGGVLVSHGNNSYPLITFGYVQVNSMPTQRT